MLLKSIRSSSGVGWLQSCGEFETSSGNIKHFAEGRKSQDNAVPFSVLVHFEKTPKALANFSPGLERSDNPGITKTSCKTLKGFVAVYEPFQGYSKCEI